jgi:hypothetical protein
VPWDTEEGGLLCRSIYGNYAFGSNSEFCVDAKELARTAIAALKADCLSTPNSGADGLYPFLEAIAAR